MKRCTAIGIGFIAVLHASSAWAYCNEPRMTARQPHPPSAYDQPHAPSCMSRYNASGENECSRYELERFARQIRDFTQTLEQYTDDVYDFERAAKRYAADAVDYAKCLAREASKELQ